MLDYKILNNKPSITMIKDGKREEFIDLLAPTYNRKFKVYMGEPFIINEYYVARPDLISLAVYKTDMYADIICKLNGISNPFELNENMIIYCPDITVINNLHTNKTAPSALINKNATETNGQNSNGTAVNQTMSILNSLDMSITSSISKDNDNDDLRKSYNERRSSGEQTIGDTNYIIDKSLGIVIY